MSAYRKSCQHIDRQVRFSMYANAQVWCCRSCGAYSKIEATPGTPKEVLFFFVAVVVFLLYWGSR